METSSGLLGSLRTVAGVLLALGRARLQLASTEIEEERLRIEELMLWAIVALFCFGMGLVFATLLLVLLTWNGPREMVVGALAVGFLGTGGWAITTWRRKARSKPPFLAATLAELQRDTAAIARHRP